MKYDSNEIKNSLTLDQITEVIIDLGGSAPRKAGDNLICETLCHNHPGEGSHKLYYYDNTKLFKCFTNCGDYFDIFDFVAKAKTIQTGQEWDMIKGLFYVAQKFGFSGKSEGDFEEDISDDWSYFEKYNHQEQIDISEAKELKEFDDTILKHLPKVVIQPWIDEGITQETLDRYEIGFYPNRNQITIPHRDVNNRLVGLRVRTLLTEVAEKYGKYGPLILEDAKRTMYNHPLGFSLYGLNLNKENIRKARVAVIFESEKSVLLYESIFGRDSNIAVACCGSSITKKQIYQLISLGVTEIIIAFDRQFKEKGTDEFNRYTHLIEGIAKKYKVFVTMSAIYDRNMITGYKSSPIDEGKDKYCKLIQERITF